MNDKAAKFNALERLQIWSLVKSTLRTFFLERSYLEVETPTIVTTPGAEPYQRYFDCTWTKADLTAKKFFLRASPELEMKWLMTQGCSRIFQMGKCFRSGGEYSNRHHPEFTMLEWYHKDIDFLSFITLTLDLIASVHRVFSKHYGIPSLIATPHFFTVQEAFQEFAHIDLTSQERSLNAQALDLKYPSIKTDDDFDTTYFKILLDIIEPAFKELELVVLHDFLPAHSALATVKGGVAKRFEIYFRGQELCNGYEELTDYKKNLQRFKILNEKRTDLGLEAVPLDDMFFSALREDGLPPCCGNALGLDRLLAAIFAAEDIKAFAVTPGPFGAD